MDSGLKKLTALIDQLLILLRDYPGIIIPSKERHRLETVVNKLLHKEIITPKEWEQLRPYIPESEEIIKKRQAIYEREKVKAHNEKVRPQIEETRKMNFDLINKTNSYSKKIAELNHEIRIKIAKNLPARIEFKICKKCNKKFTVGEFVQHEKDCGKKKKGKQSAK
ncbi:MAG TPA: hypothetical protein PK298_04715 [Chitinophagaceae bacterium]|nr:hypothetical protein [Chitinophagaceae bacterium]HQX72177.1 hypothetical protein [Chitinophagaceae bacterium]